MAGNCITRFDYFFKPISSKFLIYLLIYNAVPWWSCFFLTEGLFRLSIITQFSYVCIFFSHFGKFEYFIKNWWSDYVFYAATDSTCCYVKFILFKSQHVCLNDSNRCCLCLDLRILWGCVVCFLFISWKIIPEVSIT